MGKSSTLRLVLRNFLDHYGKLEDSVEKAKQTIKERAESGRSTPPPLSLYAQEFLQLKHLTESLKSDDNYPTIEGHKEVNRKKNRYKDILPYDNSRVILSEYPGVPGSDYINANFVRGSSGNQRAYIASQGPLPNTLVDFWRMIWETEVLVIVMACNEREADRYKCEPYWPLNAEEKQQYGNITVEHVKWRQVCPDFLVRTFKVSADNQNRTICQFHYTTWPDHGVPNSVQPILELVRLIRDVQSSESRPILVHCSAGCGRTGTICSIDFVWALLRTGKLQSDFSLHEIISDMRRQRIALVQTVEQYILCYKAVATLFEQHLKLIDSHTYENVDDDGEPLILKTIIEDRPIDKSEQSLHFQTSSSSSLEKDSDVDITISNRYSVSLTTTDNRTDSSSSSLQAKSETEESFEQNDLSEEAKPHEKLIGKATVIRRPSIAKLKAIFDNPKMTNLNDIDQMINRNSGTSSASTSNQRLQRSQSIKENIRNFNFNFHLEINQPNLPNRRSKSYTMSTAKMNAYKKTVSSDCSNRRKTANIKLNNNCPRFYSRPPSLTEMSAPPKPPRTYQHIVDDSCLMKTSEGRLIVTVAQPRSQHPQNDNVARLKQDSKNDPMKYQSESIYEQLIARKYRFRSSPNLAITEQFSFVPSVPTLNLTNQQPSLAPQSKSITYCDNFARSDQIYANPLAAKSFPMSMFSLDQQSIQKTNPIQSNDQYAIYGDYGKCLSNVFNPQNFQNHQAKPIMLQSTNNSGYGYFEPIYGRTDRNQFVALPKSVQQFPQAQMPIIMDRSNLQIPDAIRHQNQQRLQEQIYSNREICFNRQQTALTSIPSANLMNVPIKENIYSEINLKSSIEQSSRVKPHTENESNDTEINDPTTNSLNPKVNKFNKICRALKFFRFKSVASSPTVPSTSQSSSIKSPQSSSQSVNTNPAQPHPPSSSASSSSRFITQPKNSATAIQPTIVGGVNYRRLNSNPNLAQHRLTQIISVPNGLAINPINDYNLMKSDYLLGQLITPPPHSYRFQTDSPAQWTQV
ncbi:tyrosine phosphatase-like protein [Sarcoptes scabiei]|uniref:protein-tyrosine-phosphatase n=1 Tax=Sarcoptes scabiei TaxID=52283 RepID=A0A131ZXM3_SARSC|nr:tyrosine phosphatase-like protein [Sarcoptes scabiei]